MSVLPLLAAVIGAAFGSFDGALAARVPAGRSILPRSSCDACSATLGPVELVPVASWLVLRGRCRHCHARIPVSALVVELACAAAWAATTAGVGVTAYLPAALAGVTGLVALAAVDWERHLLPNRILYPTLVAVGAGEIVAAAATGDWSHLWVAAVAGLCFFGLLWLLYASRPGRLGFGDVRLGGLIGLLVGWQGPASVDLALLAGCGAGLVIAGAAMLTGRAGTKTHWPLGTFLALGAVVALGAGPLRLPGMLG